MKTRREAIYRSFWPKKDVVRKFGERGVDLVCVFAGNTLNSLGAPYSDCPPNWIRFICMIDLNTPPGILDAIEGMKRIWDRLLASGELKPAAQIAVVVDAESCLYMNQNDKRCDDVLYKLRPALGRIGAPYALHSFADLGKIDFNAFKLVIFPNLFLGGSERLKSLKAEVLRDGRTALWIGLAGVVADGRYDEVNVEKLTGLRHAPGEVGQADFGSWKSVLHSDLGPSSEFLRKVAAEAGVHLYGELGEPIYANERLLATHVAAGGRRKFKLPKRCSLARELFSNRVVARDCDAFEDELESPGSVLYELEP